MWQANPSLQGQSLYTDGGKGNMSALATMDKVRLSNKLTTMTQHAECCREILPQQIYRLLGKSITLAA